MSISAYDRDIDGVKDGIKMLLNAHSIGDRNRIRLFTENKTLLTLFENHGASHRSGMLWTIDAIIRIVGNDKKFLYPQLSYYYPVRQLFKSELCLSAKTLKYIFNESFWKF